MVTLLLMMAAAAAVATLTKTVARRSSRPAPTVVPGDAPQQVDRNDFHSPNAALVAVVFTSASCSSCAQVWAEIRALGSRSVATQNVEVGAEPHLHERYGVDSVPLMVIADASGSVQLSAFGPLDPSDRSALHELVVAAE